MQIGTIDDRIRRVIEWLAVAQEYLYRAQAVPAWTSADGRVTPITELDDQHLENCIRLIERNAPHAAKRSHMLPALRLERERRRINNMRPPFSPGNSTARPIPRKYGLADVVMQRTDLLKERVNALELRIVELERWSHPRQPVVTIDMMKAGLRAALDAALPGPSGFNRFRAMCLAMGL